MASKKQDAEKSNFGAKNEMAPGTSKKLLLLAGT